MFWENRGTSWHDGVQKQRGSIKLSSNWTNFLLSFESMKSHFINLFEQQFSLGKQQCYCDGSDFMRYWLVPVSRSLCFMTTRDHDIFFYAPLHHRTCIAYKSWYIDRTKRVPGLFLYHSEGNASFCVIIHCMMHQKIFVWIIDYWHCE